MKRVLVGLIVAAIGFSSAIASPRADRLVRAKSKQRSEPVSIAGVIASLRADAERGVPPADGLQEAITRLTPSIDGLPRCLTPILDQTGREALVSAPLAASIAPALAPPKLSGEIVFETDDHAFAIHYTQDKTGGDGVIGTDVDASGTSDYVETVAAALEGARARIVTKLGFRDPARSGPLPVYLTNLGGHIDGYTVPRSAGRPSFLVIDSRLLGNDALLRAAVAHQFAHASLDEYEAAPPAWWTEASAAWLEGLIARSFAHFSDPAHATLATAASGLGSDDLRAMPGRVLWASYLASHGGGRIVRTVWENLAGQGEAADLWRATDQTLRGIGITLEQAFSGYALWLVLNHPPTEAPALEAAYSGNYTSYPAAEIQTAPALGPFGMAYFRLAADGPDGGARIRFEGDAPGSFQAQILLTPRDQNLLPVHAVVTIDARGHGEIGIPWATYSQAILIVGNVMRAGAPSTYSFVARPDPAFPFELSSFSAQPEDGDVILTWETESEDGLFGWIVYRSEGTNEAANRVNDMIVPALGDGDGPVAYQYLDAGALRGRSYSYKLVGITHDGLTKQAPAAHVEVPDSGASQP